MHNNPVYQAFGQNDFVSQFKKFMSDFHGNPQQQVQQMLNTGQLSQAKLNSAIQTAQQLMRLLR